MIEIEKFIPGGQTIATAEDGKKIFFWNALPDELVAEYQITKNKSHYAEAIATKILNPSKDRVAPHDDCFLSTSPWQILTYASELAAKQSLVVEMFREQGITITTPDIVTDHQDYFYRNKMEYSLYYDLEKAKIFPAFHARGSHRKVPIKSSSIERPELYQEALKIIDNLNSRGEEARKYQSLLLRTNQNGQVSGGLYENHQPHPVFPLLSDVIMGHEYSYSPNGFFQINLPVYELALKAIIPHINTAKVLDLYSGVGTIGLSVARDRDLTLVEVDKHAYTEMVKNAADLPNATTILEKSENILSLIENNATVILDPPRAGCDPRLIDRLLTVTPPTIIYLSCNPMTQARDVAMLLSKYHISFVETFNFFPHTPHIENLIVLSL